MGFAMPVSEWFKGPLFHKVKELVLDSPDHIFNNDYIEKLLKMHRSGINHSWRLFTILSFKLWEKHYFSI